MTSTLQQDIREYIDLDNEIKRLFQESKQLKKQRDEVNSRITATLEEKGMPGFKYNDIAVLLVKKNARVRKPAKIKKEDIYNVLKYSRDQDADVVIDEVLEALKGDITEKLSLKIQKRK